MSSILVAATIAAATSIFSAAALEPTITVPDVTLVNQLGQPTRLLTDVIGNNVAIINFVFTTCTTVCPPLGASFSRLQKVLDERGDTHVRLISISVDPDTDTPARLLAWGNTFHAGPRWTLLGGSKANVHQVLKAFGVYTADKVSHSTVVLIGNAHGSWTRGNGLAPAAELAAMATRFVSADGAHPPASAAAKAAACESAACKYFTNTVLVDQDGVEHRLYADLIENKVVIINVIFTTCQDSCPMMAATFARLQQWLGARLNRDVHMLSISVDPETDTPARLKAYAKSFNARPGWYMLTGKKDNVEAVLRRLGQYVEQKENHSNVFLIGNSRTGLWKKAFGMASPDKTIEVLDSVLKDGA